MTETDITSPILRIGGISYLHVPSMEPAASARFYERVFGWTVHVDPNRPNRATFEDGTGHVIGAWVTDRRPSNDSGMLPYVYVEDVAQVLERVVANGGQVAEPIYPEGDLRVATFSDPWGNVVGAWQRA